MHPYTPYLILDIKNAIHPPKPEEKTLTFEEEMAALEKYATGVDIPCSIGQATGLRPEHFPPPDQLSYEDMELVNLAMTEMLESWHHQVFIPENVPVPFAYSLLIKVLESEAWYMPSGYVCHDFCTGYAPDCELKEYCPCLKHWNDKPDFVANN